MSPGQAILTKISARIHCKTDLCNIVIWRRGCFRPSERATVVRVADGELVIIRREGVQVCGFDLFVVRKEQVYFQISYLGLTLTV